MLFLLICIDITRVFDFVHACCLIITLSVPASCFAGACSEQESGRVRLKPHGTRWRAGGEMKGKQANGMDSQYCSTLPRNTVYPALLPTIKTYDKLPSSMVSRELSSKIRQFQHHCFHITLNLLLTQWVQLFPVLWYDIIFQPQLGWHPVAVVQYTFTHEQYIEQHK